MPDALSPAQILPAKPESVRTADWRDESAIYNILIAMHRHNNSGWGWPYRPEIVLARIETATRHDVATRTNPNDKRIGVIGPIGGPLIGTVGIFQEPPVWFTSALTPTELWLYVRQGERAGHYERDLMAYATWVHASLKAAMPNYPLPFPLLTGFMHLGNRIEGMERLWRVKVERGWRRRGAFPFSWTFDDYAPTTLRTGVW